MFSIYCYIAYNLLNNTILLVADWQRIAAQGYFSARFTVKPVGLKLGEMLKQLVLHYNIDAKNIHILGHSLGAHVAAEIGKVFNGGIGRITGFDPALPLFSDQDNDCISETSALFVDIIHTCGRILGAYKPQGMVDFYPNFGVAPQPGCEIEDFFAACTS